MKFKRKRRKRVRFKIIFNMTLIFFVTLFVLIKIDKYFIPTAISISENFAINEINNEINNSVRDVISNMGIKSNNFFESGLNDKNKLEYLNIDTMLINRVCSEVSTQLTSELHKLKDNKIKIPLGMFFGINILSDLGPKVPVTLTSLGNSTVDYETEFESVGINQINYQVWLIIDTNMDIISPFYTKQINVKRKLMLVNTVITGEIPNTYLGLQGGLK